MSAAHAPSQTQEALLSAYRFITQPQRMDSPKGGPGTATYHTHGYNALVAQLRTAIAANGGFQ